MVIRWHCGTFRVLRQLRPLPLLRKFEVGGMVYGKCTNPNKIKVFLWCFCPDRLPTGCNLSKKGIEVPNCCYFMGGKLNTVSILFGGINLLGSCGSIRNSGTFLLFSLTIPLFSSFVSVMIA